MDVITIAAFLGTLAILFAGYALYQSFMRAAVRLQRESDSRAMRPRLDGGRFVGGSDKPGSN